MKEHWDKIERRLTDLGCADEMQLCAGADPTAIAALERHIGLDLPPSLKDFLAIHDGQLGVGLIFGQQLLPVSEIRREWDVWRSIDEEEMNRDCADMMSSEPEGFIKPMYCNRRWIPLTSDAGGNHIGLDFDPDVHGNVGQVIAFGRDEDTKRLLGSDFDTFILSCITWLEGAQWNGEYLDGDS